MGKKICFALLFLFAISFTVADSLFGFLREDGVYVTVPNFIGQKESLLVLPQWAVIEASYRFSDEAPAGVIINQAPAAGSRLKVGNGKKRSLTLTVSLGTEEKTVPNVIGQDVREATATLRDHGFTVIKSYAAGGKSDEVIAVAPAVGTALAVGGQVTVTVSRGESMQTVTVPDLMGLSRSQALLEVFQSGLSVETVSDEPSDSPDGTVIRQSPTAGSLVAPNTKIKLTVSQNTTE